MPIEPSPPKTQEAIGREWDRIAGVRRRQIDGGKDVSFTHVLRPKILELLESCDLRHVIDLGCGTGEATKAIGSMASTVVGVDLSSKSIALARERTSQDSHIEVYQGSVEEFPQRWTGAKFTTAVANMTLMDCLDLDNVIQAVVKLLTRSGSLVATITHPWFWPLYWGYHKEEWFDYHRQVVLQGPFATSLEMTEFITTHVHRPLAAYMEAVTQAGFVIDRMDEPLPNKAVEELFGERWEFPRFLALRARRRT